uniref:Histone acetyltransferase type B catalytic subunit n=1 Tax=Megaselia scalaris TaxID=36166 RepID=T1H6S6_MEGSC
RSVEDLEDGSQKFPPEMAHQIFGENENIFGYEDLAIDLYYTAGPLNIYLDINYGKKADDILKTLMKADDILSSLVDSLPNGICYLTNKAEFVKSLEEAEKFQPFGEVACVHFLDEGVERHFEIYYYNPKFVNFFSRLETFVLWFVDAASYIDLDDPQWNYFLCYEKFKNKKGELQYATVGYSTVYKYYAYPENIRPRISQMLVLPPFQKLGIGTNFIRKMYDHYVGLKNVIDITVEDPSDEFKKMRNYIDSKLCRDLKSFSESNLKKGFSKEMVKEARNELKINPKQSRIVYEILRLFYTNVHDESDYKNYRLSVKQRLNHHYYKQLRCIEKMEKLKIDTSRPLPTPEQRLEQLDEEYKQVEENYELIVDK